MGRPASRISVLSPFSVSSFAAQPPVIPDPTTIAPAVAVGIFSPRSGFAQAGGHGIASVLRAGNNFQLQLFFETDFGSVVAMNRDAFEDFPEIAFQLAVGFGNRVAVPRAYDLVGHHRSVERSQLRYLLLCRCVRKILAVKRLALLVDYAETVEKTLSRCRRGPFSQNQIDEFVDTRSFRARCVGRGNDLVDHRNYGVVQVTGERSQSVAKRRLCLTEQREQLRSKTRQNRAC